MMKRVMVVLCMLFVIVAVVMFPVVALAEAVPAAPAAAPTTAENVLSAIWGFLNSGIGITAIAVVIVWILSKSAKAQTLWKTYEGDVIAGVRYAEKLTENGVPASGKAKLNAALQYVINVIEASENRRLTDSEQQNLLQGIQVTHNALDAQDVLTAAPGEAPIAAMPDPNS
jgi:hypothetical protein